ncbi:MAG: hypothetical protein HRU15_05835 [Planctomycetes bacterium]|nr:hypothetical protein [Planctomycetota bacterium]
MQRILHTLVLIVVLNCCGPLTAAVQIISDPTLEIKIFQVQDYQLVLEPTWQLPSQQLHDAYDADRNQQFIRILCIFHHQQTSLAIPAFAMKKTAHSPWTWHVRWTPTHSGQWTLDLQCDLQTSAMEEAVHYVEKNIQRIDVISNNTTETAKGFLTYPGASANQRYFQITADHGQRQSEFLYGNCRAWMVTANKEKKGTWQAEEWADRSLELLPTLREGGFNVLNTWFAPWEYQIIHCDQAEYWRNKDDSWQRHEINEQWSAYQYYDQGRARSFDRLLQDCEGQKREDRIYLLLAPLPHVSFQQKAHPWGGEGCWSPQDDPNQRPEKCNGFSQAPGQKDFWDFFKADPAAELDDWRSQLFDHQANYFRYVMARWGSSPSIGLWEIFDEIDAIGNEVGLEHGKLGWWKQTQNKKWLENISLLFSGQLQRSDKANYAGDAYQHPLHCATTSHAGEYTATGNMRWTDLPDQRMSVGWHWYPFPNSPQITSYWLHCMKGISEFSMVWGNKRPHFISEFGNYDRLRPQQSAAIFYPSLYHFGIWTSTFSGQAISAMDWDDGKEYGELRWRTHDDDSSAFSKKSYAIDHVSRMQALRKFTKNINWDSVQRMGDQTCLQKYHDVTKSISHILFTTQGAQAWSFILDDQFRCEISALQPGKYHLQFFDPWTGLTITEQQTIIIPDNKSVIINGDAALAAIKKHRNTFNAKTQRLFRGFDLAWKLLRQP